MADADLNINLNESQSTETFSATGEPTSSNDQVNSQLDQLAQELRESQEQFIADAATDTERVSGADELADMQQGLSDLTDALDNLGEDLTDPNYQAPTNDPTPGSSGGSSGSGSSSGNSGGGPLPDQNQPNPSPQSSDPFQPDFTGFNNGGPGGPQPPDDPDFSGGLPNPGDAPFSLIGAAFGPFGVAIGAAADTIDFLIMAFEGLQQIVEQVDDAMDSLVADTRGFSGDVAVAAAMRDVAGILIKLDRAEQVGPEIAKWLETRTEIDLILGQMATDITKILMPAVQLGTDGILAALTVIQEGVNNLTALKTGVETAINLIVPGGAAALRAALDMLKALRDLNRRDELNNGNLMAEQMKQFFVNEAMPIQGLNQGGQPQIVGGFGG